MGANPDAQEVSAPVEGSRHFLMGIACGVGAVLIWAAYMAYARRGIVAGLTPADIVVLRYLPAAAMMLPWLLWAGPRDLGAVGWGRGAALALFAGPLFVGTGVAGYLFAPLSHGAVIQPSTVALLSLAAGWLLLGEPFSRARLIGTVMLVAGIALISARSLGGAGDQAWIGDLLFASTGALWVAFTVLLRRWSIAAVPAAGAVSIWSAAVVLPLYLMLDTPERLLALPGPELAVQVLVQGVGAGVLALIGYAQAVRLLGAGRAALFPALVPAATLAIGIPITGEVPGGMEIAGAILATLGLMVALGVLRIGPK